MRALGVAVLAVCGLWAVFASAADARIYWATNASAVARANLDGTGANELFISSLGAPRDVAVTGSYIYWTDSAANTIGRAKLNGTGVDDHFITGAANPQGVAVDRAHIYWTNRNDQTGTGSVGRANLDGSAADQKFIPNVYGADGVAVDPTHIYFVTNGPSGSTVGRANIDGSGVDQSFIAGAQQAQALAVDGMHIYWTNVRPSTIGRANIDGSGIDEAFIAGVPQGTGLAVDASHIYWSDGQNVTIGRSNLDGSGVNHSFMTLRAVPWGLTVDSLAGGRAPVLKHLRLSRLAFKAAKTGPAIARGPLGLRVGTTISYRDSEAAATTFTVLRQTTGVLGSNHRCVKATSGMPSRAPCPIITQIGAFTHIDHAGANRFTFSGRLAGHKLSPGSYLLKVQPRDAQGDVGTANAYAILILH